MKSKKVAFTSLAVIGNFFNDVRLVVENFSQEVFCPIRSWSGKENIRSSFFNDFYVVHKDDLVAEVGSSKSMSSGSMANDRAMATLSCCPPDNWEG